MSQVSPTEADGGAYVRHLHIGVRLCLSFTFFMFNYTDDETHVTQIQERLAEEVPVYVHFYVTL